MSQAKSTDLGTITASKQVSEKPCLVHSICGIGLAESSNVYSVYDGHDTSGKFMFRLVAGSYAPDFRLYCPALYFANGIYIEFTTNGEEVSVQYLQLA